MVKERKPRAKKPKAKQGYLSDEMAPPSIPEIDRAADDFVEARDARMRLADIESEKKAILEGAMKKHGQRAYEYDGKIVSFEENLNVRKKKAEKKPKEDKAE